MCFLIAIFFFGIGYHNIDLSVNLNTTCVDINAFGVIKTKEEIYLTGTLALLLSEILNMLGMFLCLYQKL